MSKAIMVDEVTMLQKITEIDNMKEDSAESFNREHCITPETRLVIVGTITPTAGTANGYFYTAPRNRIYGYIDQAIGTNLKEIKRELQSAENKGEVVADIIKVLKENKIAFLDVMKHVIRTNGSSSDDDIKYYCLDIESFKKIQESVNIVCNSRLAEAKYKEICEKLGREDKHIFLSQRSTIKEVWIETIKRLASM